MMKQLIAIIGVFVYVCGFSQSSLKPKPVSFSNSEQYLWSFSKNKAANNGKPFVDFDAMDNWRGLGSYLAVSDDGKYFAYTINKPNRDYRYMPNPLNSVDSLVIQSTKNPWRRAFSCNAQGAFTTDGKQYIFQEGSDLHLLQLGKTEQRVIKDVTAYKLSQNNWLAYQKKARIV